MKRWKRHREREATSAPFRRQGIPVANPHRPNARDQNKRVSGVAYYNLNCGRSRQAFCLKSHGGMVLFFIYELLFLFTLLLFSLVFHSHRRLKFRARVTQPRRAGKLLQHQSVSYSFAKPRPLHGAVVVERRGRENSYIQIYVCVCVNIWINVYRS